MHILRTLSPLGTLLLSLLIACQPSKPRILIIGDSISIGYTPFVEAYFADRAEVVHNPGNAEHSGTGLKNIQAWVGEGEWDIIQFNWGLWDLCYRHPDSKVQGNRDKVNGTLTFTVEDYAANLDAIVSILKARTNAKLIFLTTSYVPEAEAGRFQEDALRYNEAAVKIMEQHGVLVHDIYEASRAIHQQHRKGNDDVHYQPEGYEKLGDLVAQFLEQELGK